MATTKPKERSRSITKALRCTPGFAFTRQTVFSAAWSSRNAPVADDEGDAARRRGEDSLSSSTRAFEKALDGACTLAAD